MALYAAATATACVGILYEQAKHVFWQLVVGAIDDVYNGLGQRLYRDDLLGGELKWGPSIVNFVM